MATTGQLANAQLELVDSLIGREGCYFEVIKEFQGVSLGTKVLYLERAITQENDTFLESLDKLYTPGVSEKSSKNYVELIRAYKCIHDLYHNNKVLFGEFGERAAVEHYFHSLGEIDNNALREKINDIKTAHIVELTNASDAKQIEKEKKARVKAEAYIKANTQWRNLLNLLFGERVKQSSDQLHPAQKVFFKSPKTEQKYWFRIGGTTNGIHWNIKNLYSVDCCIKAISLVLLNNGIYRLQIFSDSCSALYNGNPPHQLSLNQRLITLLTKHDITADTENVTRYPNGENAAANFVQFEATGPQIRELINNTLSSVIEEENGNDAKKEIIMALLQSIPKPKEIEASTYQSYKIDNAM